MSIQSVRPTLSNRRLFWIFALSYSLLFTFNLNLMEGSSAELPWHKVPFSLSVATVGLLLLARSWRRQWARLIGLSFFCLAVAELEYLQEPLRALPGLVPAFSLVGTLGVFLGAVAARQLPFELAFERRASKAWIVVATVADSAPRLALELDPSLGAEWILAGDTLCAAAFAAILFENARRSSAAGRRRVLWILSSGLVWGGTMLVMSGLVWLLPSWVPEHAWSAVSSMAAVLLPVGMLFAALADDEFEIDGRTKVAVALAGVVLICMLLLLFATPVVAEVIGRVAGVGSPSLWRSLTIGAGIASTVWLAWQLSTPLTAHWVPEQDSISRLLDRAFDVLENLDDETVLVEVLTALIVEQLRPLSWMSLGLAGTGDFPVPSGNERPAGEVGPSDALDGSEWRRLCRGGERFEIHQRGLEVAASAAEPVIRVDVVDRDPDREHLAVLLRKGATTVAAIVLGPKSSRHPYSAVEKSLLRALARQASARLTAISGKKTVPALAAVRHDMKQPIAAIRLLGELLEEGSNQSSVRRIADQIGASVKSLDQLVRTYGTDEPDTPWTGVKRPVLLATLGKKLQARFSAQAHAKELEFVVGPDGAGLGNWRVESHPVLLERICANLVSNAIRYTSQGHVRLAAYESNNLVFVEVSDSGQGIDETMQALIFQPFTQLENSASSGDGLGLATVVELVQMLGHQIDVESEPGTGTTFTLAMDKWEPSDAVE